MKLKFKIIPATELRSGDIFYCTPDPELNEFGEDHFLTGTDQIFIKDDYYEEDDEDNHAILVNGGWHIWFRPNAKVVKLAKYRKLLRVLDMVKEGNPEMEVGENDMLTKIEYLKETGHLKDRDLLAELGDLDIDNKKEDEDLDDVDLPF